MNKKGLKERPMSRRAYRKRGGQFPTLLQGQQAYSLYQQTQQAHPQQPQQGQPGFIGTALTDLKNNKEMFQPVYDTTSSIGLAYNFGIAIIATINFGFNIRISKHLYNRQGRITGRLRCSPCRKRLRSPCRRL
jgi:hypothetical protein